MSYMKTTFYVKNVPPVERVVRVLLGIVLAVSALFVFLQLTHSAALLWLALVLLLSGLFVVATGFFGWCPACAMVGRKLKSTSHI